MKAVVIRSDCRVFTVDFEKHNAYDVLSDAVGGLIEHVDLPGSSVSMYVNEEGKLKRMSFNQIATDLWEISWGMTDMIVGDVILTGGSDDDGEELGLSDELVSQLLLLSC